MKRSYQTLKQMLPHANLTLHHNLWGYTIKYDDSLDHLCSYCETAKKAIKETKDSVYNKPWIFRDLISGEK